MKIYIHTLATFSEKEWGRANSRPYDLRVNGPRAIGEKNIHKIDSMNC
jgi:hypothetical protein